MAAPAASPTRHRSSRAAVGPALGGTVMRNVSRMVGIALLTVVLAAPAPAVGAEPTGGRVLVYEDCYEIVQQVFIPTAEFGVELPEGASWTTFDAEGTIGRVVVATTICKDDGLTVTEVFVHAFVTGPPGLGGLRLMAFTDSRKAHARWSQFCFGNTTTFGTIDVDLEITPSGRSAHVFGTDGRSTIEMFTTTDANEVLQGPAALPVFTARDGEVYGRVLLEAEPPRGFAGPPNTVILNGTVYTSIASRHVVPREGETHTWRYSSPSQCPPGQDRPG
jgi:hypothetical protein